VSSMPGTHHVLTMVGRKVTATQHATCGVPGFRLFLPRDVEAELFALLMGAMGYDAQAEAEPDADYAAQRREGLRGRPVGWLAYNTARIEAGSALFHIDFGTDSLPAETGLLDEAVSFTKGCYLGQEVVARMKSLGHPKKVLVGLSFEAEQLPVAGTQVFNVVVPPTESSDEDGATQQGAAVQADGKIIGGITSSTLSPMRGQRAIALAMMAWGQHQPGTQVAVAAEGEVIAGQVCQPGQW